MEDEEDDGFWREERLQMELGNADEVESDDVNSILRFNFFNFHASVTVGKLHRRYGKKLGDFRCL